MILKGRLKTDFLFQTTFFIGILNQRRREKRNTICAHYLCFDRVGQTLGIC